LVPEQVRPHLSPHQLALREAEAMVRLAAILVVERLADAPRELSD
jgi:hypothetical protein